MSAPDIWPDPVTLAAGDEGLVVSEPEADLFWSRLYDGSPRIAETGDEGVNFDALAALPKIRFICDVCGEPEDFSRCERHPCACGECHCRKGNP